MSPMKTVDALVNHSTIGPLRAAIEVILCFVRRELASSSAPLLRDRAMFWTYAFSLPPLIQFDQRLGPLALP